MMRAKAGWMCGVLGVGGLALLNVAGGAVENENVSQEATSVQAGSVATLAGGCFWCVESDLEKVPGVSEVVSGYSGGSKKNAVYKKVSAGVTKHFEAIQVHFDPSTVSFAEVLDAFWKHIDPTDPGGQFVDRGPQYRTAVFYHDEEQKRIAEQSKRDLEESHRFPRPIVTPILPLDAFYDAEEYHQDYYRKSPADYYRYRKGSGRDAFIQRIWGSDTEASAAGE